MPKPSSPHLTFAQCAVGSRERVWFIAEEGDDSRLLQLKCGPDGNPAKGKWAVRTPDWPLAALCGADHGNGRYEVLGVGLNGELLAGSPGTFSEAHVDPRRQRPSLRGVLRDIRMIGDDVFAVGMGHQAYRRRDGVWSDIAGKIRSPRGTVSGFNSVDGRTPDAVVAVGLAGEIWSYDGASWRQLDSPTSVALHRVRVLPSGEAVICGAAGVLLRGQPTHLVQLQNETTQDNLYDLAFFKERVFVASAKRLFVLGPAGLQPVDVGVKGPLTFGSLDASDDVLWSVGAKHLLRSTDGVVWQQVMCPV